MIDEILKSIRDTLTNDSTLMNMLGSADRIYYHFAPIVPQFPCIVMALSGEVGARTDSFGKIHLELGLDVLDTDFDKLSDILERLDTLLYDKRLDTTNWSVKYFKRIFAVDEKVNLAKDAEPVIRRITRWQLRAYKKES